MVQYAIRHSIKAAQRAFGVSRNTVRLWLRRYREDSQQKLHARRAATTQHPKKMLPFVIFELARIVKEKHRKNQRIIVSQLRRRNKYIARYSTKTILKHLRRLELYAHKKPKKPVVQDLREYTETMDFGQCIQVDIKYLTDIPELFWSLAKYDLFPKYQITARDRATGATWICYAREKTVTNTALFMEYLLEHLSRHKVNTGDITIQTDNGKEFTSWYDSPKKTLFEKVVGATGATHRCIPAGKCTYNSTVESFHNSVELMCYSQMNMPDTQTLYAEAQEFQKWYNTEHVIRTRGYSVFNKIREKCPAINPHVVILKPLFIETLLTQEVLNKWRFLHDENALTKLEDSA